MKRTVDMLIEEHQVVASFSSIALVSMVLAVLVIGISQLFSGAPFDVSHPIGFIIGLLLGTTLILSLLSMMVATFFVVKARREVSDWGSFLVITWVLPYIGISAYLGGANLLAVLRKR